MSNSHSGAGGTVQEAPRLTLRHPSGNKVFYWIWAWLPVALGIAVVALESTPWLGADRTSGFFRRIYEAAFGQVSNPAWEEIHHLLRKAGHFLGYGLIGLAWLRAWWMTLSRTRYVQDALLSLLGTGLIASWDEWHQSLLANRTASPWDVLLDCCGALALCLIAAFFVPRFRPARLQRPT